MKRNKLYIVKKYRNNSSTDHKDIDTKLPVIKTVISELSQPLNYIFHLYFQADQIPNSMKIAIVR